VEHKGKKMTDLIKLTGQEIAVAHIELTLYDIAKKFNLDHSKLAKQLLSDIKKLTPDRADALHIVERDFKTSRGNIYKTYVLDVKTAVWFISRFEPNLRKDIVDFAFKQLEKDYYKAQKKIQRLEADKFIEYDDGYHSMSRIVKKNFPDLTVTEVYNMLEDLGYIRTEVIKTTKRIPIELKVKTIGNKVIRYKEEQIVNIIKTELD
jgi:hypothetical protein